MGINIVQTSIEEVVLIGEHKGMTLIVLGTRGEDDAWGAACGVVDTLQYDEGFQDVAIVDAYNAQIRPATLRRIGLPPETVCPGCEQRVTAHAPDCRLAKPCQEGC